MQYTKYLPICLNPQKFIESYDQDNFDLIIGTPGEPPFGVVKRRKTALKFIRAILKSLAKENDIEISDLRSVKFMGYTEDHNENFVTASYHDYQGTFTTKKYLITRTHIH